MTNSPSAETAGSNLRAPERAQSRAGAQDLTSLHFASGRDFSLANEQFGKLTQNIDPAIAARLERILGGEEYVSVELERGGKIYTAHITYPADRSNLLSVQVVSDEVNPTGARLTQLHGRFQFNPQTGELAAHDGDKWTLNDTVDAIEKFLARCDSKWCVIQCNPQGFHERQQEGRKAGDRINLSPTDTGGQNRYVEDMSQALAHQGYDVIIVNRAGPSMHDAEVGILRQKGADEKSFQQAETTYANHHDLRIGKHYKHDGVHLFFIDDGVRGPDGERVFVRKEDFYPALDASGRQCEDRHFLPMAQHLATQIEDRHHICAVFGHYADGAAVANELIKLRGADQLGPGVFHYDPHSIGDVKRRNYEAEGKSLDGLRLPERKVVEQDMVKRAGKLLWTSDEIRDAMREDLEAPKQKLYPLPPGVDVNRFQPRPVGVSRTDRRYLDTWKFIANHLSARGGKRFDAMTQTEQAEVLERLQQAKIVYECSRADERSKDKPTAARAVGNLIQELRAQEARTDVYFVVNAAGKVREELERVAREKKIENNLIIVPSYPDKQMRDMYQISDIYLTASLMEGFGMSAEQAAACRLVLVSSTLVPFSREIMLGGQQAETHISGARMGRRIVIRGEGAFLFQPGDDRGAAHAMLMILQGKANTNRMVDYAYDKTIPHFTWHQMLRTFMINHVAMPYDDGHVMPPPQDPTRMMQ